MNRIHLLDRPAILSELHRLVQKSLPIKGTYIKTLEKDDIFDKPVNKTSELQVVKVGNQSIYVPIVKEPDMAEGAIPEDMMNKIIAKIKDPKSRKIISEYLEQEKAQETAAKTVVKIEDAEGKNEDYQDVIDKKKDLVDKIKMAVDEADLTKILTDNNINDFKKELGEAGLKYSLAGLTKTINATKKKLETNKLVAHARAQQAAQQPQPPAPAQTRKQPPPAPIPPTVVQTRSSKKQPPPAVKQPSVVVQLKGKVVQPAQNQPTPAPKAPALTPKAPALTPNTPKQPPAPPSFAPPTPKGPAPNYASTNTELFHRLDAARISKAVKLGTITDLNKFLSDNGFDVLYQNGSPQMKKALTRGRNNFISTYGVK